jgi:hypothetical protein
MLPLRCSWYWSPGESVIITWASNNYGQLSPYEALVIKWFDISSWRYVALWAPALMDNPVGYVWVCVAQASGAAEFQFRRLLDVSLSPYPTTVEFRQIIKLRASAGTKTTLFDGRHSTDNLSGISVSQNCRIRVWYTWQKQIETNRCPYCKFLHTE